MDSRGEKTIHPDKTSDPWGWALSVAFWLCLAAAATLYASAALAPKALKYARLRSEFYRNQVLLVALEQHVHDLRSICDALEHDPAYAEQWARADFLIPPADDERIAVDPALSLPPRRREAASLRELRVVEPWYLPLLERLTAERRLRAGLIAAAGLLALTAFLFLPLSSIGSSEGSAGVSPSPLRLLLGRYRRRSRP